MPEDLPDLYDIEQISERKCAVTYEPDETPACVVTARPGEPPSDASQRAAVIADILNATIDMSSYDIRELLSAYEEARGTRHHADWRNSE